MTLKCKSCGKQLNDGDYICYVGKGFYHEECLSLEPIAYIVRDRKTGKEIEQVSSHAWGAIDLDEAIKIVEEEFNEE